MKRFAITTAAWLGLFGGGNHHLAFCGAHWTPDEKGKAEDSTASIGEPALPSNVSIPDNVKRALQAVWKRSPTFRQQCRRIGEAQNLRITVYLVPRLPLSMRAHSTVRAREGGMIAVNMKIRTPGNYVEIIAHEFEHMLEQLEGLDLKALAAQENTGIFRNELGAYETTRAINAGRRVYDEYRRGDDRQAPSQTQRLAQSQ